MTGKYSWLLISLMLGFGQSPAIAQSNGHLLIEATNAQIRRVGSSQFQPIRPILSVSGGDELKITSGGKVVIRCHSNDAKVTFSAATNPQKVSTKCPNSEARSASNRSLWGNIWDWATNANKPTPIGDARTGFADIPYAIAPRRTMILTTRPEIRWNLVAGTKSYEISLISPNFETISWTVDAANINYQYPLNQPELKTGEEYILKIKTNNFLSSTEDGQTVWMKILSPEKQQELFSLLEQLRLEDLPEPTEIILESILYEKFELYSNAIAILSSYVQGHPEAITVRERLAELYAQIGLAQEEQQEYQRIEVQTQGEITEIRQRALVRLADFAESNEEDDLAEQYRAENKRIGQLLYGH